MPELHWEVEDGKLFLKIGIFTRGAPDEKKWHYATLADDGKVLWLPERTPFMEEVS